MEANVKIPKRPTILYTISVTDERPSKGRIIKSNI